MSSTKNGDKPTFSLPALATILKKAALRLKNNNLLHLAGSTAFFATFSLAPIFVLIIQALGTLLGQAEAKQKIIQRFAESAPDESVQQLNRIMNGLENLSGKWYVDAILLFFLLFTSSTLFSVIKSSLQRLWRIKAVRDTGVLYKLKRRLFSILLIVAAGVLLIVGLLGHSLQVYLGDAIAEISPAASAYFTSIYRYLASVVLAWAWFALVFRYLTDARPQWKTVLVGALFTTLLFVLGRFILQTALSGSNIPTVYGASASLVLLQLFVFYISILNYYGAAFTLEWARYFKQPVRLPDYLSYYSIEEKHTQIDHDHSE